MKTINKNSSYCSDFAKLSIKINIHIVSLPDSFQFHNIFRLTYAKGTSLTISTLVLSTRLHSSSFVGDNSIIMYLEPKKKKRKKLAKLEYLT